MTQDKSFIKELHLYKACIDLFIRLRAFPLSQENEKQLDVLLKKLIYSKEIGIEINRIICSQLSLLIKQNKESQIKDLADAAHVLPELFLFSSLSPIDFWNLYYLPYFKKYQDDLLYPYKNWFTGIYFFTKFEDEVCYCTKIKKEEFSTVHKECIAQLEYKEKRLYFPDYRYKSILLGAGEEKAVYCVRDQNGRVFALELIDEKHYLDGRLIDGEYYYTTTASRLMGHKFNEESIIGLQFTGLVKAREYIRGYEWGNFQYDKNKCRKYKDKILTMYLQEKYRNQFLAFAAHYKDVHDRNVMFELAPPKEIGYHVKIVNEQNKKEKVSVRLRGIDLR